MNRIRRVGNTYQCLLSPHRKYDNGFEYLIGSWTDESIMGFEVKTYPTYAMAECDAVEMPDIDWIRLVEFHKDSYLFLRDHISKQLNDIGIPVEYKHFLSSPEKTKNKMFDRVIKGQEILAEKQSTSGFRLVYDMNDIISFAIINPWTKNIQYIADKLIRTDRLNIFNRIEKNGCIYLIGRTDIGTTYEIILVTSIFYNWMMWRDINFDASNNIINAHYNNCIKTQKMIDMSPIIMS